MTGYATPYELEPGMEFRRKKGGGEMTFDHAEDAGTYAGRRWVAVYTKEGARFVVGRYDKLILVEEQG